MNRGKMPLLLTSFLIEKKLFFFCIIFTKQHAFACSWMFHHHIIWSSKLIKRPSLQNIKKSKEIWRPGLCSSASIAQKQQQHVLPLTFFCHICMYIVLYTTTILDTIFLYWLFYSTGALGLYLTKLILKATHTGGSAFVSIDKRNCQSTLKKGFSTGSRHSSGAAFFEIRF